MNKELFKKFLKNIGFCVITFGLVFSYAFLADAKSPNNGEKREKIIKEVVKIKKSKNSDDEKRGDKTIKEKMIKTVSKVKKSDNEKIENREIKKKIVKEKVKKEMKEKAVKKVVKKIIKKEISKKGRKLEVKGIVKSVDVASRIIKVAVQKARHIESVENKEVDINVLENAKIIKADEKKDLNSLAAGDRVNLQIIKSGDKLSAIKIVVKGTKAENENEDNENKEEIKTAAISLTNDGFTPNSLEVSKGTKVVWTNNASSSAQVSSDPHPLHTDFPEFGAGPAIQTGQTFEFTFNKEMAFKYHDHLNLSSTGTIIVK